MPRVWKPLTAAAALAAVLVIVAVLAADRAVAQEPAGTAVAQQPAAAPADTTAPVAAPTRRKHPHLLALTGRACYRVPIRVLKENQRNINDITASSTGFDVGLRCYPLDGLAVGARYARGGLKMTSNQFDLDRFSLTGDEYLKLDSYAFYLSAYLGGALMPDSRFDPYLTLGAGRFDWAFTRDGRGSDSYVILETPVEGQDFGVFGGIGTEYAVTGRLWLQAEWSWNWVRTALDRTDGVFSAWTNTNYWNLGFGAVLGF